MSKFRILALLCLSFAGFMLFNCSDDKDSDGGNTGKWCVFGGEELRCVEIGAKYGGGQTMTEGNCKVQYNYSIKDEKPSDCIVISE